jgi:hypothetical protein
MTHNYHHDRLIKIKNNRLLIANPYPSCLAGRSIGSMPKATNLHFTTQRRKEKEIELAMPLVYCSAKS